jgi:dTDP-4-dehydrorhamnose reductase
MKQKTIVLGRGFLGKEFERYGFEVWGRDKFQFPEDNFNNLKDYDVIINCIGIAETRDCEDPEQWKNILNTNSVFVSVLSSYCEKFGKKLVQISTGCVYDKNNSPQKETDFVSSHCRYVVSKLNAEYSCHPNDLILRPRLYFSDQENKNNLLSKLPEFSHHLTEINSYTSTKTIVEATQALLKAKQSGLFNIAQEGYATIEQICKNLGLPEKPLISGLELQRSQGLALVNNIMDISKLKRFYQPRKLKEELQSCWTSITDERPEKKSKNEVLIKSIKEQDLCDRWG